MISFFHPAGDDLAQLDFIAGRMVDLIHENGQARYSTDIIPQLVGLFVLHLRIVEKRQFRFLLFAVQDDLFRIDNCDQTEQIGKRLMTGELLNIWIVDLVRFLTRLLCVQHLKQQSALDLRRGGFRQNPGGIEILNGLQAGNHGGFQPRWGEDDEIMGKGWIGRLILRKIQIEIDESRH